MSPSETRYWADAEGHAWVLEIHTPVPVTYVPDSELAEELTNPRIVFMSAGAWLRAYYTWDLPLHGLTEEQLEGLLKVARGRGL